MKFKDYTNDNSSYFVTYNLKTDIPLLENLYQIYEFDFSSLRFRSALSIAEKMVIDYKGSVNSSYISNFFIANFENKKNNDCSNNAIRLSNTFIRLWEQLIAGQYNIKDIIQNTINSNKINQHKKYIKDIDYNQFYLAMIEANKKEKNVEKISVLESCSLVDKNINNVEVTKEINELYFKDNHKYEDISELKFGGGSLVRKFFINKFNKNHTGKLSECRNSLVFLEGIIFSEYSGRKERPIVSNYGLICLICFFKMKIETIIRSLTNSNENEINKDMFTKMGKGYFISETQKYSEHKKTYHFEEEKDFDYVLGNIGYSGKMDLYRENPILIFSENKIFIIKLILSRI